MCPADFKPNIKGFVALRNSPQVVAELKRRAEAIAEAAGEGFEVMPAETDTSSHTGRARVAVVARSFSARHREATDRVLTRAIDAGRG